MPPSRSDSPPRPPALDADPATVPFRKAALLPIRMQAAAMLSWSDTVGPKRITIHAPTTLGSSRSLAHPVAHPSVSRLHVEFDPHPDGDDPLRMRADTYVVHSLSDGLAGSWAPVDAIRVSPSTFNLPTFSGDAGFYGHYFGAAGLADPQIGFLPQFRLVWWQPLPLSPYSGASLRTSRVEVP